MEDFKDVMLSEPPQRFATGQPSHVTSNALSLESYKGILLCDRPADARQNRSANQLPPFLPPGNTDLDRGNGNLGLPPSLETRAKNQLSTTGRARPGETIARSSKAALTKHRKWLSSFASEMKRMKEEEKDQQYRATVREAALREREAAKRRGEGSLVNSSAPQAGGSAAPAPAAPAPADDQPEQQASQTPPAPAPPSGKPPKKAKKAKGGSKKPKWAMTEEEAEDAEFDEARELMDFAAELDYDAFVKDFEVQEALAIMRDRVKEIAEEKGIDLEEARRARRADDDDDAASVTTTSTVARARAAGGGAKAVRARRAAGDDDASEAGDRPAWNDSTSTTIRKALAGDALKLAERVLQTSDQLRKVHSKMSMAKLLEDAAMEIGAGQTQRHVTLPAESVIVPPRIATVAAEATGDAGNAPQPAKRILTEMRQSKSKAQNLPYLYRCPSI